MDLREIIDAFPRIRRTIGWLNGEVKSLKGATGMFDYNDLATATVPLNLTGGAGFLDLPNDEGGAFTNKLYAPKGVTDVWNAGTGRFDFSQLPLGSVIEIRLDVEVTTLSNNQEITLAIELGIGNFPYELIWENTSFKTTGVQHIVRSSFIYLGDLNTRDFPGKFKIKSDGNATVEVHGWACSIHKYEG